MRVLKFIYGVVFAYVAIMLMIDAIKDRNITLFIISIISAVIAFMLIRKTKKERMKANEKKEQRKRKKELKSLKKSKKDISYDPVVDNLNYTEKEMRKYYTLMQAQRDVEIMRESFTLAESTLNIDVFCMRHDLVMQKARTLLKAEQVGARGIKKLKCHDACLSVINASHPLRLLFLERYGQHTFEQIENLKTAKGKENRYKKTISKLEEAEETFKEMAEYKLLLDEMEMHLATLDLSNALKSTNIAKVNVVSDKNFIDANPQSCSFDEYQIPSDIMSLLWIKGKTSSNVPGLIDEPSLIDLSLPISKGSDMWNGVKLDYSPSYSSISPEQRSIYLNWLEDVSKPISIGYVFLFYYGLERYLFTEKSEDAVNMILKLRKYHQNDSFDFYTSNALAAYAMTKNNGESLEKFASNLNGTAYLWACLKLRGFLTPYDIISTYRLWGFTNKRYICGENGLNDLFEITLEEIFIERFEEGFLRIDNIESNENDKLILANFSLPIQMKEFIIPDITKEPWLSSSVLELLTEAHERVKVKMREIRKSQPTY